MCQHLRMRVFAPVDQREQRVHDLTEVMQIGGVYKLHFVEIHAGRESDGMLFQRREGPFPQVFHRKSKGFPQSFPQAVQNYGFPKH